MYRYLPYCPTCPPFPAFMTTDSLNRFSYPAVNTEIFLQSVKSFRLLMQQGNRLLDLLSDAAFSQRVMEAAQQGKKSQVEMLVKSIGLSVPITTQFTPSGVIFTLYSPASYAHQGQCCTLTMSMKWGR